MSLNVSSVADRKLLSVSIWRLLPLSPERKYHGPRPSSTCNPTCWEGHVNAVLTRDRSQQLHCSTFRSKERRENRNRQKSDKRKQQGSQPRRARIHRLKPKTQSSNVNLTSSKTGSNTNVLRNQALTTALASPLCTDRIMVSSIILDIANAH